ncbi:MAG: radical SAM protein [Pseudomonadota bacterium]
MPSPRLTTLSWILTNHCNLRCAHCYPRSGPEHPQRMAPDLIARVVAEAAAMGVAQIYLSGGEPLLLPDLTGTIGRIGAAGMRPVLCTNATLLDEAVAARLAAAGLHEVAVGLEAATSEGYARLRGRDLFDQALRGLRAARGAGLHVTLDIAATRENAADIVDIVALAAAGGVETCSLKRLFPIGRGRDNRGSLQLSPVAWRALLDAWAQASLAQRAGPLRVSHDPLFGVLLRRRDPAATAACGCWAGRSWLGIAPSGAVSFCPLLTGEVPVADLHRGSLAEAWRACLRAVGTPERFRGPCATCLHRDRCGGCRAAAWAASGDPLGADPMCALYAPDPALRA